MLTLYPAEIIVIQQIIERSRREEEMFLIDSKTAAVNILQYLTNQRLLIHRVIQIITMPKFKIEDEIPPRDESRECDRCEDVGARNFVGEWLCNNCILNDVFEEMNERDN